MNNPRTTIRFMLFFLVMLLVAPFFINGPDGKPIMTLEKFKQRFFASLPGGGDIPAIPTTPGKPDPKQTVYKFKDAKGIWHFTNETPPSDAREVSVVKGTVNRMATAPGEKPVVTQNNNEDLPVAPGVPLTGNSVKQVVDEAKKARKDTDQYNKNLEQAVNNM
ncbi:MAG: hypothetical protein HQL55_13805 [Magnetococcales bacterium]|nr:hypothetical protein [Magnetococcales bacterium]